MSASGTPDPTTGIAQLKSDLASAKVWVIAHIWAVGLIVAALLFFKII